MINKFLIYCESDGILTALRFAFKTITSVIYTSSNTIFYECSTSPISVNNNSILFREYKFDEIDRVDFPRFKLLPVKKWLESGSHCIIGRLNGIDNSPKTFAWYHEDSYRIHNVGVFYLKHNEYWLGPTFVSKDVRGKGYNKLQIAWLMGKFGSSVRFYTSVNKSNIPSLKGIEHLGFTKIGQVYIVKIFGIPIRSVVTGDILKNHLR